MTDIGLPQLQKGPPGITGAQRHPVGEGVVLADRPQAHDGPKRLSSRRFAPGPGRQGRPVGQGRSRTGHHSVHPRPQHVHLFASGRRGDPLRRTVGGGDASVQTHGKF